MKKLILLIILTFSARLAAQFGPLAPSYKDITIKDSGGHVINFAEMPLETGRQYTLEIYAPDAFPGLDSGIVKFLYHGSANVLGLDNPGTQQDVTSTLVHEDTIFFSFVPEQLPGFNQYWYAMQLDIELYDSSGNATSDYSEEVEHWTFLNKDIFARNLEIYDYTKNPNDPDTLERYNEYRISWSGPAGSAMKFLAIPKDSAENAGVFTRDCDWKLLEGETLSSNLRRDIADTVLVPKNKYEIIGRYNQNANDSLPWQDIVTSNLAEDVHEVLNWQNFINSGYGFVDTIYVDDSKAPVLAIGNISGEDIIKLSTNLIVASSGSNANDNIITFSVDSVSETRDLSGMSLNYREIGQSSWQALRTIAAKNPLKFEDFLDNNLFTGSKYEFAVCGIDDANNHQLPSPQDTLFIERGDEAPSAEVFELVGNLEYGNDSITVNYKVYDDLFVKRIQFLPPNSGWVFVNGGRDTLAGSFTVVSKLASTDVGKYMTLSLMVEDYFGTSATLNIKKFVTDNEVNVDDPPQVNIPLPDITVNEDAANTRISLANLFTDPDNNDYQITKDIYQGEETTLFLSSISGDSLIIEYKPNQYGERNIILQGTSNAKSAYDTMNVLVYPVNDPPISANRTVTIQEDQTLNFTNAYFSFADIADEDDFGGVKILSLPVKGRLKFGAGDVTLDSVYQDMAGLNFTPVAHDTGYHYASFSFKVVDEYDLESDSVYTVFINVSNIDNAPFVMNPAPDILVLEDSGPSWFLIDSIFSDIDNDDDLIVESLHDVSDTIIMSVTQIGDTIRIEYKPNKNGHAEIIISGLSNGQNAFDTVAVSITPINDNPTGNNAALTMNEDSEYIFKNRDFPYSDLDNDPFGGLKIILNVSKGVLTYEDVPVTENVDYTDVSKLKFLPAANGAGSPYTSFYYQLRDVAGGYSNSMYKMTINVLNIDDAPVIANPIEDVVVNEDTNDSYIYLGGVFTDIDNNDALIAINVFENDNEALVVATISQDTLILSYQENMHGTAVLILIAESNDEYVYDAVRVTVNPVNDPPVSANAEITIGEDETYSFSKDLFVYTDIENNPMNGLKIVSLPSRGSLLYNDAPALADTQYADLTKLTFTPAKNDTGSPYTSFQFRIIDSNGGISDTAYIFTIHVDENDDPPEILHSISDILVNEDADTTYLDLDTVFTDTDNNDDDIVVEVVTNTNPSLVLATVIRDSLMLDYLLNSYGVATIILKATSGGKSVHESFEITVTEINDSPVGADLEITINEEGFYQFSINDFAYSDIESDFFAGIQLTTLESNGDLEYWGTDVITGVDIPETVHQISLDIKGLVFKPFKHGTGTPYATFDYLLKDSRGAYSDTAYTITINVLKTNDPPAFTKFFTDTLIMENELFQYDFEVTDPDKDSIVYYLDSMQIYQTGEWFSIDTAVYGVKFDSLTGEFRWQTTFDDVGQYRFLLSAKDSVYTCYTTSTIQVLNVNRKPVFTTALSDTTLKNDTTFRYTYRAVDDDGDNIQYGMLYFVEGLVVTFRGQLTWYIPEEPDTNFFKVEVFATDGFDTTLSSALVRIEDIVAIVDEIGFPTEFSLAPAYPNPFNPATRIQYTLPKGTYVRLCVFDSRGKVVDDLVDEYQAMGYYEITWTAESLPSGIYFYRLSTHEFNAVRKCLLVK